MVMETVEQAKQDEVSTENLRKFELFYNDEYHLTNSGPLQTKVRHVPCGRMAETADGFEIVLSLNMPEGSKILTKLVE
jgi:hypothetical protein